ncbi:hypothetical protein NDU88_001171 [Pleurodeles waltl]|uniref:Uncharacterized protein n=1 Tax=Pleurodeles waltl TaxID=8319 RepID=A0AAV7V8V2_PLEWA|nr:hypothetical protein NDU88_001171 [Pleurodeles waltl]
MAFSPCLALGGPGEKRSAESEPAQRWASAACDGDLWPCACFTRAAAVLILLVIGEPAGEVVVRAALAPSPPVNGLGGSVAVWSVSALSLRCWIPVGQDRWRSGRGPCGNVGW